ncbi:MAG: hypothetical protein FJX73_06255 [Armatimonadetes bacterium]|nr:hypothetical protein [Armatimonadota bacterium]
MSDQEQREMVAGLARSVVEVIAPQELPGFSACQEAFFADAAGSLEDRTREAALRASGTAGGAAVVSPVALAVASEVVAFILNEIKKTLRQEAASAISAFVKRWLARLRSAGRTGEPGVQGGPGEERSEPDAPPELSSGQIAQIYVLAVETARQFRLSTYEAARMADVTVRSLAAGEP